MCGIIGYSGPSEAKTILLNGLAALEYRGYDSAGIAYFDSASQIHLLKKTGKTSVLEECAKKVKDVSHCGIGHTRWATHGGVTDENAHPHQFGKITLIHNGIIENYRQLTKDYGLEGRLVSQTDSEAAAGVLNAIYTSCGHDPMKALKEFALKLEGSYSFCILFEDLPGEIYAIRSMSPLVAACTSSGAMIASDLTALIPHTRKYFVVPEQHILRLTPHEICLHRMNGTRVDPEMTEVNWNTDAAMKNGFPHFMLKEIHQQPQALRDTILPRLKTGLPDFTEDHIPDRIFTDCRQLRIIGCGTAMHAGMTARAIMEPLLRIPVNVSIASEFRYETPLTDSKTLVIIISQSGETIDTLAAMRLAQDQGSKALAIVNVNGSAIARESNYVFYTHAGPEIAVASTKAYSVQLAALYLICCRLALVRGNYHEEQAADFLKGLLGAIPAMETMLRRKETVRRLVSRLICQPDVFFIGRGLDYTLSLEGALKLKEISYIHAEACAAGELKHGTIALISQNVPVIAIATQSRIFSKTISNIREVKARGAFVILLVREGEAPEEDIADICIPIPDLADEFTAFPIAAVLQLLAYYVSAGKNLDVDRPRNLAKSVTVE